MTSAHRTVSLVLSSLAAALLSACAGQAPVADRSVQIERTRYGIAHVTAPDYEGIGYGVAYAFAQDNVCEIADYLLTVRGDRSAFLGAGTMGDLGLGRATNAQIDLFVRFHMDDAALASAAATTSADVKAAMRGYVAGYNRYLAEVGPQGLPASCRDQPWVRPMTLADLSRATELSMIQGGVGALAGAVLAAAPPSASASTKTGAAEVALPAAVAEIARRRFNANPQGGELGSNGWAFGRNATPDGHGVLLGNPHFPWVGINRFWELHQTIPGTLDVMGSTGGLSPLVTIGFNHDIAWTHTVSTGQRFTLYELKLDPTDPTVYLVDGQPRKMTATTVALPQATTAATPASGATPASHTFYSTDWGPVLSLPRAGLGWSATTAYAIRDANTLNVRSVESWMKMGRARNVEELRTAMANQGIPWINTIAADRDGNAMYADQSVVPDVSAAQLADCAPSPRAAALLRAANLAVLDGSRSTCAWHRDPDVAAPGILSPARMPVLITPDWVQNSNDSYWLANPNIAPMADVSPLVGPIGVPQRLRTRSAIMEIEARLAGTDGLPGRAMGSAEVRSVILRDRNLAGNLVMDDLSAACTAQAAMLPAEVAEGCSALGRWNRHSDADSAGAPLFREFWRKAKDVPKVWRVPFDPARPVATPAGLDMAAPTTRDAVFRALGDAVGIVRGAGFPADVVLGKVQSRVVHGQVVTIPGGDEFEGVLNKVETKGQPTLDAGGYRVNYGSSYLQAVSFDAQGPVAFGLLTYGQSSEPGAPRAYDQLPLFSAKQWLSLPFHAADVERERIGSPLRLAY